MSADRNVVIAIDGPAASGKSTVALSLACRLKLSLIDSGSMYRSVTLLALERNVALDDEKSLRDLAREVGDSFHMELKDDRTPETYLGERNVSRDIRSAAVGEAVSPVSAVPGVREEMVRLQRSMAMGGAVVEGRDIGTKVLPDAPLKVYLDATVHERANRRFTELEAKGQKATENQVAREIAMRDRIDSSRVHSPLAVAKDALVLDTTDMAVEEVVDAIMSELDDRGLV